MTQHFERALAIGFCVTSFIFVSAGSSPGSQRVSRLPDCRAGEWSRPETLSTGNGKYLYVERPSVFVMGKHVTLIGSPAFASQGKDSASLKVEDIAGATFDTPGSAHPILLPSGVSQFGDVRSTRTSDGRVHAIWEMIGAPHADSLLWTSDYSEGRWSAPIKVSTEVPSGWNPRNTSELLTHGTAREILLSTWDKNKHQPVVQVITWQEGTVGQVRYLIGQAIYLTATMVGDSVLGDSVLVGYIGQNAQAIGRENDSIYVASIPISGTSGRLEGKVVSSTGGGAAYDLRLLAATPSRLYLVWHYTSPTREGLDSVQLSTSRDGGRKWTQLQGLAVPGSIDGLYTTLLPDAGISLAFRQPARKYAPTTVDWTNGSWHPLKVLDYQAPAMPVTALVNPKKQLLIWGAFGPLGPRGFPVTLVATRKLSCDLHAHAN
jgi:hypothetical protein